LATWSSITEITSGFAKRVHLTTIGGYSAMVTGGQARIARFSGVCGDKLSELFKQKCNLGTIYTDLDCYTTNGVIYASSQHAADFLTEPVPGQPSSDDDKCRPTTTRNVSSVTISGGSSVYIDEGLSLSAAAKDNNGASASDLCPSFTWSSSNPSVATVSEGSVMGVGTGSTTIYATCSGVTGSLVVSSSQAPLCDDPLSAYCSSSSPPGGGGPVTSGYFVSTVRSWDYVASATLVCENWHWVARLGGVVVEEWDSQNCYFDYNY
jgi:Bacterial Ig-like domain (group 2)